MIDLTGKKDVYVSYNSIYEQNQDSIGAVEYSIDQGATWNPITGNLVAANLRTLEVVRGDSGTKVLLVGAEQGVFRTLDPVVGANNWAGQVQWADDINRGGLNRPVCPWLSRGWLFVAATGEFYSCCYANGDTPVIGHVDDPCQGLTPHPWRVCEACGQRPPSFNEISPQLRR